LETAKSENLCQSRIAKKWRGTSNETTYLEREAVACVDYPKLRAKAAERGPEIVSRAKYGKSLDQLTNRDKMAIRAQADAAIREEARLINLPVDAVLRGDVRRFETAINEGITTVALRQGEFDALVSLAFNIGTGNFAGSTLRKKINENKYRTGDAAQRQTAIDQIEIAFLAWDKSGGKQLPGLTARRKAEADAFLKSARDELAVLRRARTLPANVQNSSVPMRPLP